MLTAVISVIAVILKTVMRWRFQELGGNGTVLQTYSAEELGVRAAMSLEYVSLWGMQGQTVVLTVYQSYYNEFIRKYLCTLKRQLRNAEDCEPHSIQCK